MPKFNYLKSNSSTDERKIQTALYAIAEVSTSAQDSEKLYHSLHKIIAELMYADNFLIAMCKTELAEKEEPSMLFPYFCDTQDDVQFWSRPISQKEFFADTISGYVFKTGEALLASKEKLLLMQDKQQCFYIRGKVPLQWLGVPLKTQDKVFGVLVVQSYDPAFNYTEQDKELLVFVSQHIAMAVMRKQAEEREKRAYLALERRVQERTKELLLLNIELKQQILVRENAEKLQSALFRIADLTNSSDKLDDFFTSLHEILKELMYAENLLISTIDPENPDLVIFPYYFDSWDPQALWSKSIPKSTYYSSTISSFVFRTGKTLLADAAELQTMQQQGLISIMGGSPPVQWLGAPLRINGDVAGVIVVQSYDEKKRYNQRDKDLLTFVSQHISTALQRKQSADLLKQAHQRLKKINNELERRVALRTKELSHSNQALQRMLVAKEKVEAVLAHKAKYDPLTNLPNRDELIQHLQIAMRSEPSFSGKLSYALLFLDLDRFKVVNDSLGHISGDQLLCEVGARLRQCTPRNAIVSRLGGDEFCILLHKPENKQATIEVGEQIIAVLSEPFTLNAQQVFISASVGITLSSIGYDSPMDVLRDADAALYQAKGNGRSQVTVFGQQLHLQAIKRLDLENQLRSTVQLNCQRIEVYYQPIVHLETGEVRGLEALARWQTHENTVISPTEFIPIAEETGLIIELGLDILYKALSTIKTLRDLGEPMSELYVSVNLSILQISQINLFEHITQALKKYDLPTNALKLEITESMLINNFQQAKTLMDRFSEQNIAFMLDDFGTGYSSLNYLHQLPLNGIKIDQSFLRDLGNEKRKHSIIQTIKTLANNLDMEVISEGVENSDQIDLLKSYDLNYGQGYYFAKPMNIGDTEHFLEKSMQRIAANSP